MQFKGSAPANSDSGAQMTAQLLTNDQVNLIVEDTSVLNTGIIRGNVVKYSVSLSKWVLCDGTVKPDDTDIIGVVEHADGTSGQVRLSGVYQDTALTTIGNYYCQADGSLGTVATKVSMGTVTSTGKLCMPGGSGGGVQPATVDTLGGIIVGEGLRVTTDGILSAGGHQLFTSSGTFTAVTDTVYLTGCGGGGGSTGGAYDGTNTYYGASGGGGAACIKTAITVVPGQSYAITVGAGGSAGTKTTSGGAGGATSFGALLSLAGGGGGSYSLNGGAGGSAGGAGGSAGLDSNTLFGYGGSCIFGSHTAYKGSGAGVAGSNYGSGGAGGYYNQAGAAGSQGFMLVEW